MNYSDEPVTRAELAKILSALAAGIDALDFSDCEEALPVPSPVPHSALSRDVAASVIHFTGGDA